MTIDDLHDAYDARLKAGLRRGGIDDPMTREDLCQDAWAKLSGRGDLPPHPAGWLFRTVQRDARRHRWREGRMRAWEEAAAELGHARGGLFDFERAIQAVAAGLSLRETEILDAAISSRTEAELAARLGLSVKTAQSTRSRLKARVRSLLSDEVDVAHMFMGLDGVASAEVPSHQPLSFSPDSEPPTDADVDASATARDSAMARVALCDSLRRQARVNCVTAPVFGGFSRWFGSYLEAGEVGSAADWASLLRLSGDEIGRLLDGSRNLLELDPDWTWLAGQVLGISTRDIVGLALGDLGLRPLMDGRKIEMITPPRLPLEEAQVRIRALHEAAEALATD